MEGILLIVIGAVVCGFGLIFLLALAEKRKKGPAGGVAERKIDAALFEKICIELVERMKLEIEEVNGAGTGRVDIFAVNNTPLTGGRFLVHCLFLGEQEVVGASQIIELSSAIIQDRLSKGIFITTGTFTKDLPAIGELAPIEFVDGVGLRNLVDKHLPDYRVILS